MHVNLESLKRMEEINNEPSTTINSNLPTVSAVVDENITDDKLPVSTVIPSFQTVRRLVEYNPRLLIFRISMICDVIICNISVLTVKE